MEFLVKVQFMIGNQQFKDNKVLLSIMRVEERQTYKQFVVTSLPDMQIV